MIDKFIPDIIADNIYNIDYNELYNNGIRLLIFDIDGTILKSMNFNISEELVNLFVNLRIKGFTITLLTNAGYRRLDPVLDKMNVEFGIANAKKPKKEAFDGIVKKFFFSKNQIVMIGNDIFMDVYGANRYGIKSILVGSLDLGVIENKINSFILKKIKGIVKDS